VQLTESITSGFERMTSCVTSVISLGFFVLRVLKMYTLLVKIVPKRIKKNCNKPDSNPPQGDVET